MEQTEHIDALAEALAKASKDFKPVTNNRTAEIQGKEGRQGYSYGYATLGACINATRPALAANGLSVVQFLENAADGMVAVMTQLSHSSGQWLRSYAQLPVANVSDPKATGSALTYLRRFSYCAVCGIAADEDDDGTAAGRKAPEPRQAAAPRPAQQAQQPTQRQQTAPVNPEEYRFRSGAFQGKTLQEAWDSGEAGKEFIKKCTRPGSGPAFIRDQALKIVAAWGKVSGDA